MIIFHVQPISGLCIVHIPSSHHRGNLYDFSSTSILLRIRLLQRIMSVERNIELNDKWKTQCKVANFDSNLAVIVAHPWGPLGGNMRNNVVASVCMYFQRYGVSTIRFDFCGAQVGTGKAQVDQTVQLARETLAGNVLQSEARPRYLLMIGYSYGSLITASASADIYPSCIASISIAPPFGVKHWLLAFHSDYHLNRARLHPSMPRLMIIGDKDNFTSEGLFQSIVKTFPAESTSGAVLKDLDHFFVRHERDILKVISQWIQQTFPQLGNDLSQLRIAQFAG